MPVEQVAVFCTRLRRMPVHARLESCQQDYATCILKTPNWGRQEYVNVELQVRPSVLLLFWSVSLFWFSKRQHTGEQSGSWWCRLLLLRTANHYLRASSFRRRIRSDDRNTQRQRLAITRRPHPAHRPEQHGNSLPRRERNHQHALVRHPRASADARASQPRPRRPHSPTRESSHDWLGILRNQVQMCARARARVCVVN